MRKLASIALAAAAFALPAADMASQKWVDMKIREAQGLRKADIFAQAKAMLDDKLLITKATQPLAFSMGTNGMLFASFARRTVYALMATNSLNATITNGATFAWAGNGVYTNAHLASAIFATRTNFVWNGIGSTFADGRCFFGTADGFGVTGVRLTEKEAREARGE